MYTRSITPEPKSRPINAGRSPPVPVGDRRAAGDRFRRAVLCLRAPVLDPEQEPRSGDPLSEQGDLSTIYFSHSGLSIVLCGECPRQPSRKQCLANARCGPFSCLRRETPTSLQSATCLTSPRLQEGKADMHAMENSEEGDPFVEQGLARVPNLAPYSIQLSNHLKPSITSYGHIHGQVPPATERPFGSPPALCRGQHHGTRAAGAAPGQVREQRAHHSRGHDPAAAYCVVGYRGPSSSGLFVDVLRVVPTTVFARAATVRDFWAGASKLAALRPYALAWKKTILAQAHFIVSSHAV